MITTYYRRPGMTDPAALFDPADVDASLIDPLTGAFPSWRIDDEDEPLYRATVAHRGIPGLDEPSTPSDVVVGVVVDDGPPTVVLSLPTTQPLPVVGPRGKRTRKRAPRRQRQQRSAS